MFMTCLENLTNEKKKYSENNSLFALNLVHVDGDCKKPASNWKENRSNDARKTFNVQIVKTTRLMLNFEHSKFVAI